MMNRKQFLGRTLLAGASMAMPEWVTARQANDKLRLALIGVGLRGQVHLRQLLRRKDVEIVAICDIDEKMLTRTRETLAKSGRQKPVEYTSGPEAWRDLLVREKPDAVVISTPWEWHTPMILGSLEAGVKYVGTEVVLGITLADHWKVVRAAERFG
jgi:predicted dehydrogenase